ncbi:MAG: cytochrome c3 family protein [Betaproteobacteria bacterium]
MTKTGRVFWMAVLSVVGFAGSAWAASLVGSVHDLSAGPAGREQTGGAVEDRRSCPYCHTPHTSAPATAPLWNPHQPLQSYAIGSPGKGGQLPTTAAALGQSSSVCLTCHDGAVAIDAIANVAKKAPEPESALMTFGQGQFADLTSASGSNGPQTSHPVGVPYRFAPDLVPAPADGRFPNGVRLIDGRVECASCHNPHGAGSPPFLVTSNGGSALCCTCHLK